MTRSIRLATLVCPVAFGSDRVVLAPSRDVAATDARTPTTTRRAGVLERVVVTGTINGSAKRAVPVALDVIDGRDLERRDVRSLAGLLDGSVPGIWMWEQSPTSLFARYSSVRGASSFGLERSCGASGASIRA